MLEERVQAIAGPEGGMGIVVGVLDEKGPRVIAYGDTGATDRRALNGDTVFEIASVTKVFTALLLADMVRRHDFALIDPATRYLPKGTKLPERNGRQITLVDLATHTSGLPFMPDNLPNLLDPTTAVSYSQADLYRFVSSQTLAHDIGTDWNYSNLDYWLLQEAIASRGRASFEQLLQKRVIAPLALHSTAITMTPELQARAATGHDAVLEPAPWISSLPVFNLMPAAGGMLSTANDLLRFLGETMGYEESKLAPTLAALLRTRRPAGEHEQALGWWIVGSGDDAIVFHDGGSFGFSSSLAWQPQRRVGVVVLSNQTTGAGGIARHLLQPDVPIGQPRRARRTEITLEPAVLDSYVGRYRLEDDGVVVITRDGALLSIELPADWGIPKLKLHAETQRQFFLKELPLQATFEVDADGRVTGMQVYPPRGQKMIEAIRL
ncbi:MAG TPA: serine hydrolase [Steroidobacteraceae bacterium]